MERVGAILVLAALLVVPEAIFAQTDFEKYVKEIRKTGTSESAAQELGMAASIFSGETIFDVTQAPDGSLGHGYSSALCFRPGADSEKLRSLREEIQAKLESRMVFLRQHADTDGSGFVNSMEGWAMRNRVELGVLFERVPDIKSLDDLLKAVQRDRAEVLEDLKDYAKLQAASIGHGLKSMPALPEYISEVI